MAINLSDLPPLPLFSNGFVLSFEPYTGFEPVETAAPKLISQVDVFLFATYAEALAADLLFSRVALDDSEFRVMTKSWHGHGVLVLSNQTKSGDGKVHVYDRRHAFAAAFRHTHKDASAHERLEFLARLAADTDPA